MFAICDFGYHKSTESSFRDAVPRLPPMTNQAPSSASRPLPSLRVARDEIECALYEQVQRGEAIRDATIRTETDLERARSERKKWRNLVAMMLKKYFTTEQFVDSFETARRGRYSMRPDFSKRLTEFRSDVQHGIDELVSIIERLDLLDDPATSNGEAGQPAVSDLTSVFIVHGHDQAALQTVARFVSALGLNPVVLHEQANRGQTIIEKLEGHSAVGFAVVLLTPDDVGGKNDQDAEMRPRARQNVILELGFFCAALKRAHVCALVKDGVEIPSDFDGVVYVALDEDGAWRFGLAREMKAAGLDVDLNKAM